MINEDSQQIVNRFFEAIQALIDNDIIRGYSVFADRYGINRGNFTSLRTKGSRVAFQPCWLSFLVNDFHISAHWLVTGTGNMWQEGFTPDIVKKILT